MKFKKLYITLEQELFDDLQSTINRYNKHYAMDDNNKISMDMAVFFIDYIRYQQCIRKDDVCKNGFVRIPSRFLNPPLKKQLKKYREFLKLYNFIKTIPFKENGSYGYKVSYFDSPKTKQKKEYFVYNFISRTYEEFLSKTIEKITQTNKKKQTADRNTIHLTKWINEENIQVDWKNAFDFIDRNKNLKIEQKEQYSYSLNRIRFHKWYYLRSTNDNRLHSNLTNFPSILRPFLSHKGQKLVSLDVKSSQPFILAGIFNLIIEKKVDKIEILKGGLRGKDIKDRFSIVMNSISFTSLVITGFRDYKNLVCEGDIYNHIGTNLDPSFVKTITAKNGYSDLMYNSNLGYKTRKSFESLRDYSKILVLEYMYCSIESNEKRLKEVKRIYPSAVSEFINQFKHCEDLGIPKDKRTKKHRENINKCKKLFSKFLQQLEAYIMLDVITKELSKLFPKMFIATIHDSIIVPINYELEVKAYLNKRLYEILGIEPEVKSEQW